MPSSNRPSALRTVPLGPPRRLVRSGIAGDFGILKCGAESRHLGAAVANMLGHRIVVDWFSGHQRRALEDVLQARCQRASFARIVIMTKTTFVIVEYLATHRATGSRDIISIDSHRALEVVRGNNGGSR